MSSNPPPVPQSGRTGAASALAIGAAGGTPVAVVIIWYINTYILRGEMPIEVATAAGSVIATATGVVWHIVQQLLARRGIDV